MESKGVTVCLLILAGIHGSIAERSQFMFESGINGTYNKNSEALIFSWHQCHSCGGYEVSLSLESQNREPTKTIALLLKQKVDKMQINWVAENTVYNLTIKPSPERGVVLTKVGLARIPMDQKNSKDEPQIQAPKIVKKSTPKEIVCPADQRVGEKIPIEERDDISLEETFNSDGTNQITLTLLKSNEQAQYQLCNLDGCNGWAPMKSPLTLSKLDSFYKPWTLTFFKYRFPGRCMPALTLPKLQAPLPAVTDVKIMERRVSWSFQNRGIYASFLITHCLPGSCKAYYVPSDSPQMLFIEDELDKESLITVQAVKGSKKPVLSPPTEVKGLSP